MHVPSSAPEPVEITVVESEACHFCAAALEAIAGAAATYPIRIRRLDVRSEAGRELMTRHRAAMSPLVLLDGAFFSCGRLPRRKLEKALGSRFGAAVGSASTSPWPGYG